ncbi:MAG: GerMN domain-containing protein [Firmicutes bacterium]|nr:GerMN domain-containing protein [Bacillota bacterium]
MKKILFFTLIFVCAATVVFAVRDNGGETVELYVTDAEMMRLISIDTYTKADTPPKKAEYVINRLIEGFDDNPKIRRTIPKINGCMTVKVKDGTATVNISEKMAENHPDGRDLEKLTVYSVVNSLLSIDGIERVKFTVGGKTRKDFMGYIDMRESFTVIETV